MSTTSAICARISRRATTISSCCSTRAARRGSRRRRPRAAAAQLRRAHLGCSLGALLDPRQEDRDLALRGRCAVAADADVLDKTQRHLFAWVQVQRRTLMLNKAPPNSPLGTLPYKILACPIRHGAQHVAGVLVLFKPSRDVRLRHAPGAHRRDADATRRSRRAECLRPDDGIADTSGLRTASTGGAR